MPIAIYLKETIFYPPATCTENDEGANLFTDRVTKKILNCAKMMIKKQQKLYIFVDAQPKNVIK